MWQFEYGGVYNINNKKIFGRNKFISLEDIDSIRSKFNNTDVYTTIFQYNNLNQNESDLIGPMYLDLDMDINNEDDFNRLKTNLNLIVIYLKQYYGISNNHIRFYFTGKKGFHLIIPYQLFNIKPDKNLNLYYKEIAKELDDNTLDHIIDLKIYDKRRLLRLINSINSKTGLYKVPIRYEDILRFSFEDIKNYAKEPKYLDFPNVSISEKATQKFIDIKNKLLKANKDKKINTSSNIKIVNDLSTIRFPDCILNILSTGASQGSRNNTCIILASAFFQNGISFNETVRLLTEWNETKNDPCLEEHELLTTINSAYKQVINGIRYGCSSIKDNDLCIGHKCKLYK